MDVHLPLPLLGGLSPRQFMKRHWQRKPLLVRGAVPAFQPLLSRSELFALAAREEVESRIVEQRAGAKWNLRRGPFGRRALPPLARPGWTLLVQGVDLHLDAAHELLQSFRFVPQARLDDLMISYATDGGGVGPHFDSYDVFLLQAQGRRRWRIGRQEDLSLQEGVPLKILAAFEPEEEYTLEAGDMLYLPPRYAHDGIAEGECQTYSIGFRSPQRAELARELLLRLAEEDAGAAGEAVYRDPGQVAVRAPGEVPAELQRFAQEALRAALKDPQALPRALGEYLSEPKPDVWFDAGHAPRAWRSVRLDRRTRMLYDGRHLFINGESWHASGPDARLMRKLADERRLGPTELARASEEALQLLAGWCEAGWAHEEPA
ncbi:JmjC domain-containing protein [Ramlibacter sp.]|uniref:JmjC domain-containing protein n=1 Tax=Ramlibacter sp. TaxID=1917967 RepID=UPI002D2C1E98|nr:cupin domain-containing protein [Ramlibacter sp.]HYD75776.1 cupin domain-containing protein [Ramlibacter sp.]